MNNPCEKIKDKIADYVLGILKEDETAAVDEHIKLCTECKEHLEALRQERSVLLQLGENIESQMNARENRVIEALENVTGEKLHRTSISKILGTSRITKYAAAAVVAIALLIPLSYGTSNIIKKLIAVSLEHDEYEGDFSLRMTSSDIRIERIELEVGNKEAKSIVSSYEVWFFKENDELRGTLKCHVRCLPPYKWMTSIELLDSQDKRVAYTEHVNENGGVTEYAEIFSRHMRRFPRSIHFSLGSASVASQAQKFRISFKEVQENIETTPDAWIESSKLDVVHGHVTGADGRPLAHAIIQVREKREPGQSRIAASNVITDKEGFYSFDGIEWPYRLGVILYEPDTTGKGERFQYKRLNQYLEGSRTINFQFDNFPIGSSVIFGKAEIPNEQPIREFRVDIQLEADFGDTSQEYLYQFGYNKPFMAEDGRFEIPNLPAGVYNVTIIPTQSEILTAKESLGRMKYICELKESQKVEIRIENAEGKFQYGRVLFEDGTAAVPELEGLVTQIVRWPEGSHFGTTITTVDDDGYFSAQITDETMTLLESGKTSLKVRIGIPIQLVVQTTFQDDDIFPVNLLSSERDKAGVVEIKRPTIYYGQILYENGKPAIPEVIPWNDAKVWVRLRNNRPDINNLAIKRMSSATELKRDIDKDGYFALYLSDNQMEKIKTGEYSILIYHPSYQEMGVSYPVRYPVELLFTKKEIVKGCEILSDRRVKSENLQQVLESIDKLKVLFTAVTIYANSHQGNCPGTIGLLDIKADDFQWLAENVEYIADAKAQTTSKPAETVLAYDKALLEKCGSTLVLFGDGHIEFCWPRQLEILGILRTDIKN